MSFVTCHNLTLGQGEKGCVTKLINEKHNYASTKYGRPVEVDTPVPMLGGAATRERESLF